MRYGIRHFMYMFDRNSLIKESVLMHGHAGCVLQIVEVVYICSKFDFIIESGSCFVINYFMK